MLSLDKLSGKVTAILTKAKTNVISRYIAEFKKSIHNTLRDWKAEVRMLLSVPHRKGSPSNGLYPRMRTGSLRRSLSYRVRSVAVNTRTGKARVSIGILWNPDPKGIGKDYGEELNSSQKFSTRRFFGWKDRTYKMLYKRIKEIVK